MHTLLVNPQANPRRRRRKPRRRRRNPGTLRVVSNPKSNPKSNPSRRRRARQFAKQGLFDVIQPAIEVSAGAIVAQLIPVKLFRMNPATTSQQQMSLINIAVGLGISMFGGAFLPRATANNIGVGAMARGIVGFAQGFLPADVRGLGSGVGQVTEADIDDTITRLTAQGLDPALSVDANDTTNDSLMPDEDEEPPPLI